MRTDLLIRWPLERSRSNFVVECKLRHKGLETTIAEGIEQTGRYMDRCGAQAGHLVIFDREGNRSWDERIFRREIAGLDAPITVWGM